MKVAKIKETKKNEKIEEAEEYTLKQMLIIILILLGVFAIFYFITSVVVKNKKVEEPKSIVVFDVSKITLNSILNKDEEEYYVLAIMESKYDIGGYSKINYTEVYNNYIKQYKNKENSSKFYYVDLDDALNKSYIGEEYNIGEDLTDLKVNDEVLFKIRNGKIVEYYVGNKSIIEKLSSL